MRQKKLMLLGGLRYLLPVIEEAHKLGAYVITADYLPNNIAHKYSDEYCNVSIVDKDAVLEAAQRLQIDGILSFAVDPGVVTAAYVAEKMGLPFQCSYNTAKILQDKSLFRKFLTDNGFNCPHAKGYSCINDALNDIDFFEWPVIVKPVDSAGSKGVSKVENPEDLESAIEYALGASISKHFIIEDFLEKDGYSVGLESFVLEGKLVYSAFYDQYFDDESVNPFTPSAEIWPSSMAVQHQNYVKTQLQRLFDLLEIKTGIFNVECRLCKNGKVYLMEVSPRAGGNRLAEILNYAADVNIIEAETKKALEFPVNNIHEPNYNGHFAILVLHSSQNGIFESLTLDDKFMKEHIIEKEVRVSKGDNVTTFSGANASIGTLFLKFHSRENLDSALVRQQDWLNIIIR